MEKQLPRDEFQKEVEAVHKRLPEMIKKFPNPNQYEVKEAPRDDLKEIAELMDQLPEFVKQFPNPKQYKKTVPENKRVLRDPGQQKRNLLPPTCQMEGGEETIGDLYSPNGLQREKQLPKDDLQEMADFMRQLPEFVKQFPNPKQYEKKGTNPQTEK